MTGQVVRRRVQGLAFLVVLALLLGLAVAQYRQAFSGAVRVTLQADTIGNQLQETSDVKIRGVLAGRSVLTGDLREQYRQDLSSGGVIDTYEQVSATTGYEVAEVGLQQVDESQDQATVVVFGQYVVKSVNSGTQQAPSGSECTVTDDGAQACTQTVQVTLTRVAGDWKISALTLLTTS